MEFKQLESFAAVVKFHSFTKAAEYLYASQPTISAHIRMLEAELETRLIIRTTKSVEITEKGWELYNCTCNIIDLRDNLLKDWKNEEEKQIRIGASTIPSAYILPEVITEYGREHPTSAFVINQADSESVVNSVLHGNYDVGLVGMCEPDERLVYLPFYKDHMVLITPNTPYYEKLLEKNSVDWKELLREPIILREEGSGSQKTADTFLESYVKELTQLHVVARINDQEAIKNLVAGGLGISVVSEKAIRNLAEQKKVLVLALPDEVSERYLYIVYRKDYILHTRTRQFISFVQKFYDN